MGNEEFGSNIYNLARKKSEKKVRSIFSDSGLIARLKQENLGTFTLVKTKLILYAEEMFFNLYLTDLYKSRLENIYQVRHSLGAEIGYLKASFKPWEIHDLWKFIHVERIEKKTSRKSEPRNNQPDEDGEEITKRRKSFVKKISLFKVRSNLQDLYLIIIYILGNVLQWSLKSSLSVVIFLGLFKSLKDLFQKVGLPQDFPEGLPFYIALFSSIAVIQLLSLAVFNWYSNVLTVKRKERMQYQMEILDNLDIDKTVLSTARNPIFENWLKGLLNRFFVRSTKNLVPSHPEDVQCDLGEKPRRRAISSDAMTIALTRTYEFIPNISGFEWRSTFLLFLVWLTEAVLGYALIPSESLKQDLPYYFQEIGKFLGVATLAFVNIFFAVSKAVKYSVLLERKSNLWSLVEKSRDLDSQIFFYEDRIQEAQDEFDKWQERYLSILGGEPESGSESLENGANKVLAQIYDLARSFNDDMNSDLQPSDE